MHNSGLRGGGGGGYISAVPLAHSQDRLVPNDIMITSGTLQIYVDQVAVYLCALCTALE
jgi:hypothetical protein